MSSNSLRSNLFLINIIINQNMEVSMYKKILTLLFALLWCFTLSAQDFMEVSPNLKPTNHDPNKEARPVFGSYLQGMMPFAFYCHKLEETDKPLELTFLIPEDLVTVKHNIN